MFHAAQLKRKFKCPNSVSYQLYKSHWPQFWPSESRATVSCLSPAPGLARCSVFSLQQINSWCSDHKPNLTQGQTKLSFQTHTRDLMPWGSIQLVYTRDHYILLPCPLGPHQQAVTTLMAHGRHWHCVSRRKYQEPGTRPALGWCRCGAASECWPAPDGSPVLVPGLLLLRGECYIYDPL